MEQLNRFIKAHEKYLKIINPLHERIDSLSPTELAKLQYYYTFAERQAWNIAAWHKKKQKYFEGMAEVAQGQEYGKMRDEGKTGNDAAYLSRVSKGAQLMEASKYEGDYIQWRGVAESYIGARNAIKDYGKAVESEGGNQS